MLKRSFGAIAGLAALILSGAPMALAQENHAPVAATAVQPSATEAAGVVDAFHAALSRGDSSGALALLTDDALIFEGGYAERSKAEYASHHAAADAAYALAIPSALSRRTGNAVGDLAWIASESRTTGSYKNKPVDRVTTESMLLTRQGDKWLISHIHWSSRAAS